MTPQALMAIAAMTKVAGIAALKVYIGTKIVALKAYLVAHLGATVAGVTTTALTSAAAAAMWERLKGGGEQEMEDAAAKQVGTDAARKMIGWLKENTPLT